MSDRALNRWEGQESPTARARLAASSLASAKGRSTWFKRHTPSGEAMMDALGSREEFTRVAQELGLGRDWADEQWDLCFRARGPGWEALARLPDHAGFHDSSVERWELSGDRLWVQFCGYLDPDYCSGALSRLALVFEGAFARLLEGRLWRRLDKQGAFACGDGKDLIEGGLLDGELGDWFSVATHEFSAPGEPLALRLRFWSMAPVEIEIQARSVAAFFGEQEIAAAKAQEEARELDKAALGAPPKGSSAL